MFESILCIKRREAIVNESQTINLIFQQNFQVSAILLVT
jgi:hypothetical protein